METNIKLRVKHALVQIFTEDIPVNASNHAALRSCTSILAASVRRTVNKANPPHEFLHMHQISEIKIAQSYECAIPKRNQMKTWNDMKQENMDITYWGTGDDYLEWPWIMQAEVRWNWKIRISSTWNPIAPIAPICYWSTLCITSTLISHSASIVCLWFAQFVCRFRACTIEKEELVSPLFAIDALSVSFRCYLCPTHCLFVCTLVQCAPSLKETVCIPAPDKSTCCVLGYLNWGHC